jgi:hypothetical protein
MFFTAVNNTSKRKEETTKTYTRIREDKNKIGLWFAVDGVGFAHHNTALHKSYKNL